MSHVEQLEREAEQTRSQIADTLDELKDSMTPAHMLHQLADRISDGAPAAFARNLKDQAVSNPLPVALVSAGLAWLMLTPRNSNGSSVRQSAEGLQSAVDAGRLRAAEAADSSRETAGSIANATRQTAGDAADAMSGAAGSMSDAAGSMADSVQRTVSSGYEKMTDAARQTADTISDQARNVRQRTLQSGDALVDFCREQPMLVAGLGLAIGAMVGALLPTSETEDRLVGEASDRAKESARSFAKDKYEDAKNIGQRAFDAAKDEAAKRANEQQETGRVDEVKESHPTLVPSDESELERRGYPWTDDNSPV